MLLSCLIVLISFVRDLFVYLFFVFLTVARCDEHFQGDGVEFPEFLVVLDFLRRAVFDTDLASTLRSAFEATSKSIDEVCKSYSRIRYFMV